jgi:hypothetical protein
MFQFHLGSMVFSPLHKLLFLKYLQCLSQKKSIADGYSQFSQASDNSTFPDSPFMDAFRFNQTIKMLMSAGETPEMREACPKVSGCIWLSFWRASSRRLGTSA